MTTPTSDNEAYKILLRNEVNRLLGEGVSITLLSKYTNSSPYGKKEVEILIMVPREIKERIVQEKTLFGKLKPIVNGQLKKLHLLDSKSPYTKEHRKIKLLGFDV